MGFTRYSIEHGGITAEIIDATKPNLTCDEAETTWKPLNEFCESSSSCRV